MTRTWRWNVDIFIDEHEDELTTHAEARLHTNDDTHLVGHGTAHRNPNDTEVPEIGDELAAARALGNLAEQLIRAASADIEQMTHEEVHLRH